MKRNSGSESGGSRKSKQGRNETISKQSFQCPLCSHSSRSLADLSVHAQTHTLEAYWQCDLCKASYRSNGSLKHHRISKHGECNEGDKVYQCVYCNYKTTSKRLFKQHLPSHSDDRLFVCSFPGCPRTYKTTSALSRHTEREHSDSPLKEHKCPHSGCPYTGNHAETLKQHIKYAHEATREIACTEPGCAYVAKHQSLLKSHKSRRHCKKEFKCAFPQCADSFRTERGLQNHQKIHDPSRPFACDLCPYRGKEESKVLDHKKLRHGDDSGQVKRYNCPYCKFKPNQISSLNVHIKLRHKAEPLKCPEKGCPYRSHSDEMLHSHRQKMHNPDSAFVCGLCSQRFKKNWYLIAHTRTVHEGKKDVRCPHCEYRATCQFNIDKHVKNKHLDSTTGSTATRGAAHCTGNTRVIAIHK